MRLLLLPCLLLSAVLARAEPVAAPALLPLLELAGIDLLCQQAAPMLQQGQEPGQQKLLQELFEGAAFCLELAERTAPHFDGEQMQAVRDLLDGALAQRFTAAERAVGVNPEALGDYRERLQQHPVRGARLDLVQRLDQATHTTDLASLLRYEVGKTQALLALRARGENLDEKSLQEQTQAQAEAIRRSSESAVESFMLYAYRQIPSDQLAEYADLYEQPSVRLLFRTSLEVVPQLFAERRQLLRPMVGQP
ncbi:conserved exported hypothetical protein [Pseudomonas sp. 8Z]|uniref:hypothetical protein n=1 Tax=Pseudomonas sp. 8Z TaxID=2653166 RepID=UPI0012F439A9|nr:hypothetical protein [Pseudomonas sp. 8Z]VXC86123.1 conserved exported hypothetical protein [Pseudomonas sp. 8Z]